MPAGDPGPRSMLTRRCRPEMRGEAASRTYLLAPLLLVLILLTPACAELELLAGAAREQLQLRRLQGHCP